MCKNFTKCTFSNARGTKTSSKVHPLMYNVKTSPKVYQLILKVQKLHEWYIL